MKHCIIFAMLIMQAAVTIAGTTFNQITSASIERNRQDIHNSGTVILPAKSGGEARRLEDIVTQGAPVTVALGYQQTGLTTELEGYVARVSPEVPFRVELEDSAYMLRRTRLNRTWSGSVSVSDVVRYIIDQTNSQTNAGIRSLDNLPSITLSSFRLSNATAYQALQKLRDAYGLSAYFRGKSLYVGLAYTETPGEVDFAFGRNIIDNRLKYIREDEQQLQVQAIGIKPDGSQVKPAPVGDSAGAQRTVYSYTLSDPKALQDFAREEMQRMRYEGYEGTFRSFLAPFCDHGYTVNLQDNRYPARSGAYLCKGVKVTFDSKSFGRRIIELDRKIS